MNWRILFFVVSGLILLVNDQIELGTPINRFLVLSFIGVILLKVGSLLFARNQIKRINNTIVSSTQFDLTEQKVYKERTTERSSTLKKSQNKSSQNY